MPSYLLIYYLIFKKQKSLLLYLSGLIYNPNEDVFYNVDHDQ